MSQAADNMPDIVESLRRDHDEARALLGRYYEVGGREQDWFCHLREALVRHEVAEEVAVYPAIRHAGDPVKETVDARLDEQRQAEQLSSELEKMEVGSAHFDEAFLQLREAVLGHAASEESTVFPAIESKKSFEQRRMMGNGMSEPRLRLQPILIHMRPTPHQETWSSGPSLLWPIGFAMLPATRTTKVTWLTTPKWAGRRRASKKGWRCPVKLAEPSWRRGETVEPSTPTVGSHDIGGELLL